jgi:diacylglycerol kinase family enzyme
MDVVVTGSAAHCADVAAGAVAAGREAVVVCGGDGAAYADGEPVAPLPVSCAVAPGSLAVLGLNSRRG